MRSTPRGAPAHDGTAEIWFDSVQDKDAFFSHLDYLAIVAPDERVFADMDRHGAQAHSGRGDFRQLHLFNAVGVKLGSAADALKRSSLMLREHVLEDVVNG